MQCLGGSSEVATPDSIPNSAVKHFSADGTCSAGRVGRRQDTAFNQMTEYPLVEGFFCVPDST